MHTLRHIAHKFARVLIEKQIDVHPVAIERTKQAYQSPLRSAYLQIVHINENARFHVNANILRTDSEARI